MSDKIYKCFWKSVENKGVAFILRGCDSCDGYNLECPTYISDRKARAYGTKIGTRTMLELGLPKVLDE